MRLAPLLLFLISFNFISAQDPYLDSLKNAAGKLPDGQEKADALYQLSEICAEEDVLLYAKAAYDLSRKIDYSEGMANALNNMGYAYHHFGDISRSLQCYHDALKIHEKNGNKTGIATVLNNIGHTYQEQSDFENALSYFKRSLEYRLATKDTFGLAVVYNNIGVTCMSLGKTELALEYYNLSLDLCKKTNDKASISTALINIGQVHLRRLEFDKALPYLEEHLKLTREIGSKRGIAFALHTLGVANSRMNKTEIARDYFEQAMKIALETGAPKSIQMTSRELSKMYAEKGLYKDAYEMQVLFKRMSDSISSDEVKEDAVRRNVQYQYELKMAEEKAIQEKKDILTEQEKQRDAVVRYFLIAGFILVLALAVVVLRAYRLKQKANVEISLQKEIIEEKNKNITDSINYASRIQSAILPSSDLVREHMKDHFILYRPKDIVSGDFYWFSEKNGTRYIAAVDCTGHGVPGAFMSMIGNTLLNEIVNEKGIRGTGNILYHLRESVIKSLKQTGAEGESRDGMDISLCALDGTDLEFSGANNPLWLIRNGSFSEIPGDKQPIGIYTGSPAPFKSHAIKMNKGDQFFIFTDGFADQFGGPRGKKFKYQQLQEIIVKNSSHDTKTQKELLEKIFEEWKGGLEQVDDVLVIGVRV